MQTLFRTIAIFALVTAVTGCLQKSDDPKAIADHYWQLLKEGKYTQAEKYLTRDSRHRISDDAKLIDSIGKLENGEARTIVTTTITRINPKTRYSYQQTFNTVMVLEDGEWKIDANQSTIPAPMSENDQKMQQFSDDFSNEMDKKMKSIDRNMKEGIKTLNEMFEQGSQEMEQSLIEMMDQLDKSMNESIDRLKQRREQQQQQQQPQLPTPDKEAGEGMI
jgi:ElaB/YqjD/DUF883 family membrane-anchored ribosome-binding protein